MTRVTGREALARADQEGSRWSSLVFVAPAGPGACPWLLKSESQKEKGKRLRECCWWTLTSSVVQALEYLLTQGWQAGSGLAAVVAPRESVLSGERVVWDFKVFL